MARKNVASTDTVTVACKLPSGLRIIIHEHNIDIQLHGAGSPFAIGGHGMTQGIPADKWAIVEEVHKETKWLTSGAVFAMNKPQDASDKAVERQDVRIGFEGIDPKDPNSGLPRSMRIQADGEADLGR
jgi:hypothetical protein